MRPAPTAAAVVQALADRGLTVATGESLTAGLAAATLAEVPGCSAVLMGGVVAYQESSKAALLNVSASAIAAGLVSEAVAQEMARGAAAALGAEVGIGTTGVAGPDAHGGEPVGSVWIAVSYGEQVWSEHLALSGTRAQIRSQTVDACWQLLLNAVDGILGSAQSVPMG